MRNLWIIGAIAVAAVVLVVAVVAFLIVRDTPEVEPEAPTDFPSSGDTGTMPEQERVRDIKDRAGNTIRVRDFVAFATTIPDEQNDGVYYLAGVPDYCMFEEGCPKGANLENVRIIYNERDDSFTVALLDEPLRDARARAEQFLLTTLGIPEARLCTLNYYVGTSVYVNELYAGKNLGMSFCDNATTLP